MDKPEQVVLGDGDGDARPSIPAVLYAAKSTEDKHGSIPTQLADGRAMAERNGWVVAGEYQDEGISGYKQNRGPGLEAALAHVEALAAEHGVAMLVAQHSDRFARVGEGTRPELPGTWAS